MTTRMGLRKPLLLGVATGIHTLTGAAFFSWSALQGRPDLGRSRVRFLSSPVPAFLLLSGAAVEVVADKLPFVPSRTAIGPLSGRILTGAFLGAVSVAYSTDSPQDGANKRAALGALVGASGSAGSALFFHFLRSFLAERLSIPEPLSGVIDTVSAVAAAQAAVR